MASMKHLGTKKTTSFLYVGMGSLHIYAYMASWWSGSKSANKILGCEMMWATIQLDPLWHVYICYNHTTIPILTSCAPNQNGTPGSLGLRTPPWNWAAEWRWPQEHLRFRRWCPSLLGLKYNRKHGIDGNRPNMRFESWIILAKL